MFGALCNNALRLQYSISLNTSGLFLSTGEVFCSVSSDFGWKLTCSATSHSSCLQQCHLPCWKGRLSINICYFWFPRQKWTTSHLLVSAPRTTPSFQITAQMVVPVLVTLTWVTWEIKEASHRKQKKRHLNFKQSFDALLCEHGICLYICTGFCICICICICVCIYICICIYICVCLLLVAWSPAARAWRSSCSSQSWSRQEGPPLASGSPS